MLSKKCWTAGQSLLMRTFCNLVYFGLPNAIRQISNKSSLPKSTCIPHCPQLVYEGFVVWNWFPHCGVANHPKVTLHCWHCHTAGRLWTSRHMSQTACSHVTWASCHTSDVNLWCAIGKSYVPVSCPGPYSQVEMLGIESMALSPITVQQWIRRNKWIGNISLY